MADNPGPLAGLVVMDLTGNVASAYTSLLFADFGAEVITVEPPGGSMVRKMTAAPFYLRGKKSIVLDLHDEIDAAVCRGLAADADVVIEAFGAGVADRLGLGYGELRESNPGSGLHLDHRLRPPRPFRSPQSLRGRGHGQDRINVRQHCSPPAWATRDAGSEWRQPRGGLSGPTGHPHRPARAAGPRPRTAGRRHHGPGHARPRPVGPLFANARRPATRTPSWRWERHHMPGPSRQRGFRSGCSTATRRTGGGCSSPTPRPASSTISCGCSAWRRCWKRRSGRTPPTTLTTRSATSGGR